jgi:hypothetical protein
MAPLCYRRHRFPPEIIQHAIWLYLRFTLSYRDVEELLAERGLDISYETVRRWVLPHSIFWYRGTKPRDFRASRHDCGADGLNRSHRQDQCKQADGRYEGEYGLLSGRDERLILPMMSERAQWEIQQSVAISDAQQRGGDS